MIRKVLIENGKFRTVILDKNGRIAGCSGGETFGGAKKAACGETLEEKINCTLQKVVRVVESQNRILLSLTEELESLRARLSDLEKARDRGGRRYAEHA